MHSYLKAVGFSEIKKRAEMKEIILDVIRNYDEKNVVSDHPDGTFAEFSKSYGYDCGITVCGQYDEDNRFHVEYYYPFFKGTGITTNEPVTCGQGIFCRCMRRSEDRNHVDLLSAKWCEIYARKEQGKCFKQTIDFIWTCR